MTLRTLRENYHQELCKKIVRKKEGKRGPYFNFADGSNSASILTARLVVEAIGGDPGVGILKGQTAGDLFEKITQKYIEQAFSLLQHLRPGPWTYSTETAISTFAQYAHLAKLDELVKGQSELRSVFGSDYIIKPDIVVGRLPVTDQELNRRGAGLSENQAVAKLTPFRESNRECPRPILHASISCKWTLRSDRAQNTRTEALNLIRNRKGHLAHVSVVTAEPLPTRLSAIALGTGDLDCVYHFALPELQSALEAQNNRDQLDMLKTLLEGDRLRDISDLPLDIAI